MSNGRNTIQAGENGARVRKLFLEDWDPIGVNDSPECRDEYDSYADRAYVMLMEERASTSAIATYLVVIATEQMGLPDSPRQHAVAEQVAQSLVGLRAEFGAHEPHRSFNGPNN